MVCLYSNAWGYSVLTHEAVIDANWDKSIRPLLLQKYPGTTDSGLNEARAYAYGGSVAPDMGYYPFGSKVFTNFVHYVRTGDFVSNLLDESQNVNEYAFSLGVLCHYNADKYGHPIAINRAVPMAFPKDRQKFGTDVTYYQDPISHVRTEFGFDVVQTARGIYAQDAYHAFIGFKVARPVLERAFRKTYGMDINDIFKDFNLSVETFRWSVKSFMPTITRVAWATKKKDIMKLNPKLNRRNFEYRVKNSSYYHEFGKKHQGPGFGPTMLSLFIRVIPKVGTLRDLKIKIPSPEAEKLFIASFDSVSVHYSASLSNLKQNRNFRFKNIDFDTGLDTWPGEYNLADENYDTLVLMLHKDNFKKVDASLKQNVLGFYSQCNEQIAANAGADKWKEIRTALDELREINTNELVK